MARWRVPRRVSIRWIMVAVALVAVCLAGATALRRRAQDLRRLAREYERKALDEFMLGHHAAYGATFGPSAEALRVLRAHEDLSGYYSRLQAKYERAAAHPWLPAGADPPAPVWPAGIERHEL